MAFATAVIGMVAVAVVAAALAASALTVWQRMRMGRCRSITGILDSSTDGVFAVGRDWRLIYMNDRARVLLGAPPFAEGKYLWNVVPDAVTAVFGPPCRRAMDQQELVESDLFHPQLEAWFALCAYPIPDGLAVSFRDRTAVRQQQGERVVSSSQTASEPAPHVEDVPLAGVLELLATTHRPEAEGRGATWRPGPVVDAGVMLRTDRALLLRMIGGLIEAAVRPAAGGTIGLDCRISPRAVQIVVRSSAAAVEGDVGLAAVQNLARRLNHPVSTLPVEQGAEWTVTVPRGRTVVRPPAPVRAAAVAVAGLAQPSKENGAGRRCILLVDDDPIVLMGLEAVLSEWGYDIVTAASADQAMERLAVGGHRPDMVMADYQLRNNRVGTEVVSRVRERFGPVPGVILTGETGGTCQAEAAALGVAVMVKPVTPQQLAAVLSAAPAP
mgnify:CR=1 FL=1